MTLRVLRPPCDPRGRLQPQFYQKCSILMLFNTITPHLCWCTPDTCRTCCTVQVGRVGTLAVITRADMQVWETNICDGRHVDARDVAAGSRKSAYRSSNRRYQLTNRS